MNVAALASYNGSSLDAVMDAQKWRASISLCLVISNNSKSTALKRAHSYGAAVRHLSSKTHPIEQELDEAICDSLHRAQADVVLLSGYMKPIGKKTLHSFEGKIINTHPSLLPAYGGKGFFGEHVHQNVIAVRERVTGATLHYVSKEYDSGRIIRQKSIIVQRNDTIDTLTTRVKALEKSLVTDYLTMNTGNGHR
ncbi:MAG: formyltransferase family protein [Pseudomonadota bacterium]